MLTAALAPSTVPAAVPAALVDATLNAAVMSAAGMTAAGGLSVPALALAERTLKAMALTKLKVTAVLLLAVSALAGALGTAAHRALLAEQPGVQDERAAKQFAYEGTRTKADTEKPKATDRYGDPLPEGAIARIGTSRLRSESSINVIAFSSDGNRLAFGNEEGHVCVFEAADGKPLLDIRPDKSRFQPVTELAFSPDGQTLAAGGYWSEIVWLLDSATGKVRHTVPNTAEGQNHWARERQGAGFRFTPDGRTLVVGGKDGALHLWDTATGTEQAALPGEKEMVRSLTLTADGQKALTAHSGGALHLWDVTNRKHVRKLAATAKYPHFSVLSPDGKAPALVSGTTELELWEPNGGRLHQIRTMAAVAGLGFTPDGTSLFVAERSGNIGVWNVRTGTKQKSLTCPGISLMEPDARMGPWLSAWFRPDGEMIAWSVFGTIRPWDLTTGQETPQLGLYRQGIEWAGFSSDGRSAAAASGTGELGVWDAATGLPHGPPRKIDMLPQPRSGPHYISASDRRRVVAITAWADVFAKRPQTGRRANPSLGSRQERRPDSTAGTSRPRLVRHSDPGQPVCRSG